jgi:hypothetical protein
MKKSVNFTLISLACSVSAGCYQKVSENGNLTFSFQPWVALLVGFGGLAAVPVGMLVFRKQRFRGVLLMIIGPLLAVAVAPGLYLDRVIVNQEGFYSRHGFWWSPSVHQIRYEELATVRLVIEEKTGRRGKTYSYFFDCSLKSGKQERVPLGDIMREALPEIADQFRQHGVQVLFPPNLPD